MIKWPSPTTKRATNLSGSTMASGTAKTKRDWYGPRVSRNRRAERGMNMVPAVVCILPWTR